jgi:type I restriction enzyme S subunit
MTNSFPTVSVADLIELGEAELKTGPFGTQLKAREYTDSGVPVINVRNIGMGMIKPGKLEFISDETRDRLSSHVLKCNDIVFGRKGAVERHVFIRKQQDGWFQGSDCLRLRFNSQRISPAFASYFFLTEDHKTWMMNQCSHGATMASLNQGILERIVLPVPSLEIQRHIVGILSAYDDLIENNQRRMQILEEMARSLYREWFVKFRFPGHEKVPLVESSIGLIPSGWKVKAVGDSFQVVGGGTPSRVKDSYWEASDIVWYSPRDLTAANSMFIEDSLDHINALGLQKSSARIFSAFSVMLTSRATIGAISINTREACTNQGFITCLPNANVPLYFLFHWLKDNVAQFERLASGATFKEISRGVFKTIGFIHPESRLVDAFESTAKPLGQEILTLQRKNQNLRQARDLLLPRLLSGQIDLEVPTE